MRFRLLNIATMSAEGKFNLVWVSRSKWREELEVAGFRSVEIGGENKYWRSATYRFPPLRVQQFHRALKEVLEIGKAPGGSWLEVKKVSERKWDGVSATCLDYKQPGSPVDVRCFDPQAGTLLGASGGAREPVPIRYEYSEYAPFRTKLFPRRVRVFEAKLLAVEAEVEELKEQHDPRPELFIPMANAEEWETCDQMEPPKAIKTPDPEYPPSVRAERKQGQVVLSVIVEKDGLVGDREVIRSADPRLNSAAVAAVSRWRFRPPMCNGVPVRKEITVEMNFRLY